MTTSPRTMSSAFVGLAAALLIVSHLLRPADAQVTTSAAPGITQTQLDAVKATADAAQPVSTIGAAVMANLPWDGGVAPTEVVGGAVGSSATVPRGDRPPTRITRAAIVATDASGNWAVTWATPLPAVPLIIPVPIATSSQHIDCDPITVTTTGATGRCWMTQALPAQVQLSLGTLLTGLLTGVNNLLASLNGYPTTIPVGAGVQVQVTALPKTQ